MLVLGVEHWRIEENLACLLCYSKLGLNESTRCYGKLSAAVFSDEFGAKFAGECQLKINLYSVYGLPVTVAEGLILRDPRNRSKRRKSPLSSSCHSIGAVLGKGKLSLVSEGCDAMSFLIFSAHFVAVKRNFLD